MSYHLTKYKFHTPPDYYSWNLQNTWHRLPTTACLYPISSHLRTSLCTSNRHSKSHSRLHATSHLSIIQYIYCLWCLRILLCHLISRLPIHRNNSCHQVGSPCQCRDTFRFSNIHHTSYYPGWFISPYPLLALPQNSIHLDRRPLPPHLKVVLLSNLPKYHQA